MLKNYIKEELVWLDAEVDSASDIFKLVYNEAISKEMVNEGFLDSIITREKKYPTGLDLGNYKVAIPHTDSKFIEKEFIAIIRPKEKISFQNMEDASNTLGVDLVILMALKGDSHLRVLQYLINKIQDQDYMQNIIGSNDKSKVIDLLKEEL